MNDGYGCGYTTRKMLVETQEEQCFPPRTQELSNLRDDESGSMLSEVCKRGTSSPLAVSGPTCCVFSTAEQLL